MAYPRFLAMVPGTKTWTVLALAAAVASCVPGAGSSPSVPPSGMKGPALPVPEEVTAQNLELALRRLKDLEWAGDKHDALRGSIVHELNIRFEEQVAADRIQEAAGTFRTALSTFTTEEILAGGASPEVASMARTIKDRFSPLGDESKVMVALLVLRAVHPEDHAIEAEYGTLAGWAEEAREGLDDEAMRIMDLVRLYEEVAMVLPLPAITGRLLDLYVERQELSKAAYEKMVHFDPSTGIEGLMEAARATQLYEFLQPQVRRTSYLVTRLFTRIGTPTNALSVIEGEFGGALAGSMQNQVHLEVMLVLDALDEDPGKPANWMALARLLAHNDDLDLAGWACRQGWRLEPADARFPQQIGLFYGSGGDLEGAREYLELALSMDEDRPEIYEDLLELYASMARTSLDDHDASGAGEALALLVPLLERFEERWPNAKKSATHADVEKLSGLIAIEKGDAADAAAHLEKALGEKQDVEAHLLLARVHMLTRDYGAARAVVDKGLKVAFKKQVDGIRWKSMLHALRGDILHLEGKDDEARVSWNQALDTGLEALQFVPSSRKAEMEALLGLLLHKLGRADLAVDRLKRAVAGGASTATYETVLSYLVARGDLQVAETLYHFASTESNLPEPDLEMYTLWYLALHFRLDLEPDPRTSEFIAKGSGTEWPGPIFGFASGAASYEAASSAAGSDTARRLPLLYLRACQLLGQGDVKGASGLLGEMLATGRIADPHYAMALETLSEIGPPP